MPIQATPYALKDVSVTLELTGGAGTPIEYHCQLTSAALVPSTNTGGGGSDLTTFCGTYSSGGAAGGTTWVLQLGGWLALADATDLSRFLFENDGKTADFVLVPGNNATGDVTISSTNPGFSGSVNLVATQIGGTAGEFPTWTVDLPCTAKPTLITVAPVVASAF
jgi:hypothetical protein